jgi:hypothetical protein
MLQHVDTMIGFSLVMLLLSLLVTVMVQGVSAILNLRGRNLCWGIKCLIEQLDPDLKKHAELIARKVVRHTALSHVGRDPGPVARLLTYLQPDFENAEAVRADELVRVLGSLASDPEVIEKLGDHKTKLLDVVAPAVEVAREELHRLFPRQEVAVESALNKFGDLVKGEASRVEVWYQTVMDRSSERFAAHTRWATVFFALVLSFGLSVDSIALLKQISGDAELRARLVQSADATMKVADDYATKMHDRHVATEALRAAVAGRGATAGKPELSEAIPDALQTRSQGRLWIDRHIKDQAEHAELRRAYEAHYDEVTRHWVDELYVTTTGLKEHASRIALVPEALPPFRSPEYRSPAHVVGMTITMLFLSLGAPFWFNLLRQLANLRPLIAGKVEKSGAEHGHK